jgi:DNA-binding NarL/FixJ family response regulator
MGVGKGGTTGSTRVVVCAPDVARREMLDSALAGKKWLDVSIVESVGELIASGTPADLVVIAPPCGSDLARLVADVHVLRPLTPIIVLRHFDDPQRFFDCLMAGAAGFCDPAAGPKAIIRTVKAVVKDGVAIPRPMVLPLVEALRRGRGHIVTTPDGPVELTRREWEVLLLIRQHRTTQEMADQLFVSNATVRSHVAAVLHKLGVTERSEVIDLLGGL